jgi:hypothetical protein
MKGITLIASAVIAFTGCTLQPDPNCMPKLDRNNTAMAKLCIKSKIDSGVMFRQPIDSVRRDIKLCTNHYWSNVTSYLTNNFCEEAGMIEFRMKQGIWYKLAKEEVIQIGESYLKDYNKRIGKKKTKAKPAGLDI